MAWTEESSVGNASLTNITTKLVDDPFGVTDHEDIRANQAGIVDIVSYWNIISDTLNDDDGVALQGVSKHIRTATGDDQATGHDTYGWHEVCFTFEKTLNTGVGTRFDFVLDNSIDWRDRYFEAWLIITTPANGRLPGDANDNQMFWQSVNDGTESTGGEVYAAYQARGYNEAGIDPTAAFPAANSRNCLNFGDGNNTGLISPASTGGTSVAAGDLMLYLDQGVAGPVKTTGFGGYKVYPLRSAV